MLLFALLILGATFSTGRWREHRRTLLGVMHDPRDSRQVTAHGSNLALLVQGVRVCLSVCVCTAAAGQLAMIGPFEPAYNQAASTRVSRVCPPDFLAALYANVPGSVFAVLDCCCCCSLWREH